MTAFGKGIIFNAFAGKYPGVPSSVIARISYDAASQTLKVIFLSGSIYHYLSVPQVEYDAMKAARSKGVYLNEYIKPRYSFIKVD